LLLNLCIKGRETQTLSHVKSHDFDT
jgi:hypothetical protein